ncbi:MAG TPA: hypothetical protein VMU04_25645 [Candidatus Acidoferrum sp.]|nr:hypothetical protein [Candidatus Acidoferrum sp.]
MKGNIKNWFAAATTALLLGSAAVLTSGCAGGTYATGPYSYYDYDYYPDLNVYYYPAGGYYNWYQGGVWHTGRHLPPRYTLAHSHHERLRFRTNRPWSEGHHPFEGSGRPGDEFGEFGGHGR